MNCHSGILALGYFEDLAEIDLNLLLLSTNTSILDIDKNGKISIRLERILQRLKELFLEVGLCRIVR